MARRYELRFAGLIYIATTLFTAIGAFNSQNNLLFWAFGIGVAGLIVSGVVSGSALMGVRARRYAPGEAPVGGTVDLRYLVVSQNSFIPGAALVIRETPAPTKRGVFSGRLSPGAATVPFLKAGGRAAVGCSLEAQARGPIELDRFEVASSFPFGLVSKSIVFSQPERVLLTPARVPLRDGLIVASGLGRTRELVPGGRSGAGSEFYGLREYVPGDSTRTIAWRRSAAGNTLLVREFADPSPPVVRVLVDARTLGGAGSLRFERAVAIASALLERARERGHSVALDLPATAEQFAPSDDPRMVRRARTRLATLDDAPAATAARPRPQGEGQLIVVGESVEPISGRHALRLDPMDDARWLAPGQAVPKALAGAPAEMGRAS
ncbi:MAG: DUF58 domain-containing protein [Planctomycetota bacterium]